MRVIVVGMGKLGRRVVAYVRDKHDVLAIERDPARAQAISEEMRINVLTGDGDEPSVLLEAGADHADVLVAVTGHDEDNLVAALLAKHEFKIRKVIAACRNPRNRWLFNRSWGVDVVVDSAQIVGRLIEEEATLGDVVPLLKLRGGEFTVTAVRVSQDSGLAGKRIVDLSLSAGCQVAAVLRGAEVLHAASLSQLELDDELLLVLEQGATCSIEALRNGESRGAASERRATEREDD